MDRLGYHADCIIIAGAAVFLQIECLIPSVFGLKATILRNYSQYSGTIGIYSVLWMSWARFLSTKASVALTSNNADQYQIIQQHNHIDGLMQERRKLHW